jgi:sulfatase modifying factor 1
MSIRTIALVAVVLLIGASAQADVFNLGAGYVNLETVFVGNPGNTGELSGLSAGGYGTDRICGSVDYSYSIGKYEVTAKQYTDFLNSKAKSDPYGLYSNSMVNGCHIQRSGLNGDYSYSVDDDWANRPVNYVSYWDACRFVNWLGNGQGDGDTETGAYTLEGYTGDKGLSIQRNAGWQWAVTSEDEWYKAAYYKGGGTDAGYWDYPTQSETVDTGMANYYSSVGHLTTVGSYAYASAYGTYDQGGNVWEWNETVCEDTYYDLRGLRGGMLDSFDRDLKATFRHSVGAPSGEESNIGFRVSAAAVPEPSSILVLFSALAGLWGVKRRK